MATRAEEAKAPASDDVAGLGTAETLDTPSPSLSKGLRNTQDAISVLQKAEGSYSENASTFVQKREDAVESAQPTLKQDDSQRRHAVRAMKAYAEQSAGDRPPGAEQSVLSTNRRSDRG